MMRDPDGVGESEYAEVMDLARVYLKVQAGRVVEARFQTYGCGPSIAASSAGTELARGCRLEELAELPLTRIISVIGALPEERRHAAEVVVSAIRAAARDALARARPAAEEESCSTA